MARQHVERQCDAINIANTFVRCSIQRAAQVVSREILKDGLHDHDEAGPRRLLLGDSADEAEAEVVDDSSRVEREPQNS